MLTRFFDTGAEGAPCRRKAGYSICAKHIKIRLALLRKKSHRLNGKNIYLYAVFLTLCDDARELFHTLCGIFVLAGQVGRG